MGKHRYIIAVSDEEHAKLLTLQRWYGGSIADAFRDALRLSYREILKQGATPATVAEGDSACTRRSP